MPTQQITIMRYLWFRTEWALEYCFAPWCWAEEGLHTDIEICDRAWENRPLCYNFRFRDIGTALKRAIHSMQR